MAMYVSLIQFTDQGIRNIKDTVKRGDAAIAEAEKMGMKIIEEFWTMGAYDVVVLFDAHHPHRRPTAGACLPRRPGRHRRRSRQGSETPPIDMSLQLTRSTLRP